MAYCTVTASEGHAPENAPNCTQYTQCTAPDNHHTPDKHKHALKTSQQTRPEKKKNLVLRTLHKNILVGIPSTEINSATVSYSVDI